MQPLTRQRLAGSAYRSLGLSASADQAAVDAAARRLRIWPDPSRIPPTPWDLPWLGPAARERTDIEQAVAQLANPESRVEEQLLWYLGTAPPPQTAAQCAKWLESRPVDAIARHDAALAALHLAYANDSGKLDVALWKRVIEQWRELANSSELAQAIERIQASGNFDKPVSSMEIAAAASAIPAALADALVPRAHAALDQGDEKTCAAMLSLLGNANESSPTALVELLDRLEDTVTVHCREMEEALRKKLLTNHSAPHNFYDVNQATSREAQIYYNENIVPHLRRFWPLAANDPHRLLRMRSRCAAVLELLATGWEWAAQFTQAEKTLLAARELGEGSATVSRIQATLDRVGPLAARERAGYKPPRPKIRRQFVGGGKSRAWVTALAVLFGVMRALAVFNTNTHKNSTPPQPDPLYFQSTLNTLQRALPTSRPAPIKEEPWQSTGEASREQ